MCYAMTTELCFRNNSREKYGRPDSRSPSSAPDTQQHVFFFRGASAAKATKRPTYLTAPTYSAYII